MLVLGWFASGELGAYAAARRIVFGFVALGLLVPAAYAPTLSRAFASGAFEARRVLVEVVALLLQTSLPIAVALMLAAGLGMSWCFGDPYRAGAPYLCILAARLPCLLLASTGQVALVAFRREHPALQVLGVMLATALASIPVLAVWAGTWGVGLALVIVEASGAVAAWLYLRRLGLAPAPGERPKVETWFRRRWLLQGLVAERSKDVTMRVLFHPEQASRKRRASTPTSLRATETRST
jgi:O-antigen/teichoic acid export membrane protein